MERPKDTTHTLDVKEGPSKVLEEKHEGQDYVEPYPDKVGNTTHESPKGGRPLSRGR